MRAESLLLISGAFAGFRRQPVLTVGGFDPACLVEDYELIHRLHRYAVDHELHWQTRVLGNARARTAAPSNLKGFLRQRRRWFAGFLQTQYWNRDMTGNRRFGQLGTLMMPVKAIDTVQPIYGLTAFFLLIWFLAHGKLVLVGSVFSVITAKILIDFGFHLWSVHLYRRWTGDYSGSSFVYALLSSLASPSVFSCCATWARRWAGCSLFPGAATGARKAAPACSDARVTRPGERSINLRHQQGFGHRLPDVFIVAHTRRQLDRRVLDLVIRHLAQQMLDAVQARAFLVDGLHHPPRRFGDMRALQHHFLRLGVLLPATARFPDPSGLASTA